MNSVIRLLFYKTYEDRISKLKIISIIWFLFLFIVITMSGTPILGAFFIALAFTVPVFSIGLILRILIVDEDKKAETEDVKTIDDAYSKDNIKKTYMESDNVGTRQDSLEKANAYWLGTRLQMDEKPPFSLYTFKSAEDAKNALLELPFIHKAEDTGNLICEKVMEFGYYPVESGEYEAIISGFDYTSEEFSQAEASFKKHNGTLKNNLEPSGEIKEIKSSQGDKNNVKFRETITENQYTYECYDGKTKADAMDFLKDREVTKGLYYVCVYTPEGNFGRDINGIYEM